MYKKGGAFIVKDVSKGGGGHEPAVPPPPKSATGLMVHPRKAIHNSV